MSTWTNAPNCTIDGAATTDGTKIYGGNGDSDSGDYKEYDPGTDTTTTLGSTQANANGRIVEFNGDLYHSANKTSTTYYVKVRKWNGSSWDEVFSYTPAYSPFYVGLCTDGTHLVLIVGGPYTADFADIRYSSDGSTWNTGSWSNRPNSKSHGGDLLYGPGSGLQSSLTLAPLVIIRDVANRPFKWSAGTLTASTVTSPDIITQDAIYYWREDSGNVQRATDVNGTWTTQDAIANTNPYPAESINIDVPVAYSWVDGGGGETDLAIHLWDTGSGDWGAAEVVSENIDTNYSNTVPHVIRLDDGSVYAQARLGFSGGYAATWGSRDTLYDPPTPATYEIRHLGLASDSENLYVTGCEGGTLTTWVYDLSALSEQDTYTHGNATYTELDNLERGVFPAVKPGTDNILYIYGRDGSNNQVQYLDRNGTLGVQDIGPGTATWGTAKYAAGLMPAQLVEGDVIVAFDDDDIYRTTDGTTNWVKMGDATSGLRATRRYPTSANEIILGGTATGTIHYTHNFGVSYEDAGGTALGTINWFEVSR